MDDSETDYHDEKQPHRKRRQVGRGHLRDQVVEVAILRLDTRQQGQKTQHPQPDHNRGITDGGGDECRLHQVFTHGKQPLGDSLVTNGVGQHGTK